MQKLKNIIRNLNKDEQQVNEKNELALNNAPQTEQRETWTGKFDFFLSALGYAVGLGAVWRFPYLCYRNGGGVFLIPYFIFMIVVGIPLVFLELGVGQFISSGPLTCWKAVPIFRGIGLSMNIVNSYVNLYYNMIMAYSLYYLVLSFTSKLPWQNCGPTWKSPNCVDDYSAGNFKFLSCEDENSTLRCDDGKCYNLTALDGSLSNCSKNTSMLQLLGWWNPTFPSQDYWNKVILQKSSGIDESGTVIWQLMVAMLVAWIIVYAMVIKGIQVSGKVVYFTSLFPYVILLILGIRGWMLPGASNGIIFYLKPDLARLGDVNVWADAASQIFFTLSVAYGGLNSLASYNKFDTNILRDAIVVSLSNCLTSVFAGFVVFAYVGYLSHTSGQSVDQVIQAGQGLSFVVYPYAVTTIPAAPLWSILFFIMMLILGMDTMMTSVETTITSILDVAPSLRRNKLKKFATITGICIIYYIAGFIFTFKSGTYWIEIFDYYSGNWAVFLVAALESVSIYWFYGPKNFKKDMSIMIGKKIIYHKLFYLWDLCFIFIIPVYLVVLTVLVFIQTTPIEEGDYKFPYWTHILGQCITASTLSGVVVWAIALVVDALFFHKRPLLSLIQPDFENWKPLTQENQKRMRIAHGFEVETEEKVGIDNPAVEFTSF